VCVCDGVERRFKLRGAFKTNLALLMALKFGEQQPGDFAAFQRRQSSVLWLAESRPR